MASELQTWLQVLIGGVSNVGDCSPNNNFFFVLKECKFRVMQVSYLQVPLADDCKILTIR